MLSPWPESIFAYLPMWDALAARCSLIAVDLPGFGPPTHSMRMPESCTANCPTASSTS
jgi:pimeloyl-ACP methyl ester carboxylesterase